MLHYNPKLKALARDLRHRMTECERILWNRLRRKQLEVTFYRQKPIGNYVADFYAPTPRLVVEVDGGGHFSEEQMVQDRMRDQFLQSLGIATLRFTNTQIIEELDTVIESIRNAIHPPGPSFKEGGERPRKPHPPLKKCVHTKTLPPLKKGRRGILLKAHPPGPSFSEGGERHFLSVKRAIYDSHYQLPVTHNPSPIT